MKTLNDFNYNVGQEINIFIDNRDQIAIIDEIFDDYMLVTIHKSNSIDSFAIGLCEYCNGSGFVMIHGRENTPEDCPECNGWMLSRKGEHKISKTLTLNEIVPDVIRDLKELDMCIKNKDINTYQIGLCLTSILYSLEHPEKHFSDGTVVF